MFYKSSVNVYVRVHSVETLGENKSIEENSLCMTKNENSLHQENESLLLVKLQDNDEA